MKVMVIPDIHLKTWMFHRACECMEAQKAEKAVCLMDIADDWNQQFNIDLYIETYDAAIAFAKKYPDTLWCYGNHDICYLWNRRETGYSCYAVNIVCEKLHLLRESLPDEKQIAYIHRIDDVLFSHGGLSDFFVREYVYDDLYYDADAVIACINQFGCAEMWQDDSPLWLRPQSGKEKMYQSYRLLQIVGHTPVNGIVKKGNLISCDVFSTRADGRPIGTQEFLILDTETWEYQGIK